MYAITPNCTAEEALARLREGNNRFVANSLGLVEAVKCTHLADLVRAQKPFAVILGCSDSRVPAEVIFDCGLGELFVIRVAGNIAAESQIGSIEYAATQLGPSLVVVLGHTCCGAIGATLDALQGAQNDESLNIKAIVDLIGPAVAPLLNGAQSMDRDELIHRAVRANVRRTMQTLRSGSPVIEDLVRAGKLRIVGAEYSLADGEVDFFES